MASVEVELRAKLVYDDDSRDYGLTERKQQEARQRKIECLAKRERERLKSRVSRKSVLMRAIRRKTE